MITVKNILFCYFFLLSSWIAVESYAQQGLNLHDFFDRTSLEAGVGIHKAIAPTKNLSNSDFTTSINSFYGGMHYELDEEWGVRGSYTFHNFENKDASLDKLTMHKLMLEITYSVGSAFSAGYYFTDHNSFDLLLHGGLGASLLRKENHSVNDFIKTFK